jgi:DNA-binding response OmpR family regulator
MKIVIVDDHADTREMLRLILESENHTVYEMEDGIELIKDVDTPYDLYIIDASMPRLDGIGTIKLLRKLNITKPIIMYSAFVDPMMVGDLKNMHVKIIDKVSHMDILLDYISSLKE